MRKFVSIMITLLLAVFSFPSSAEHMPNTPKDQLDTTNMIQDYTLTASDNPSAVKNLNDNSINTVWKAKKGATLTIQSQSAIGSIYIKWDRASALWSLTSPDSSQDKPLYEGGKNGFLDEYVSLPSSENSITLTLSSSSGSIADIFVFGNGDVPDWVQKWQPMLDKADMLVFVAHADDELLWLGGTLPVYAGEYHKKVEVAYLIHHGAARNEYFRNHELLDGLWKVGVKNYPMISNFEDYYSLSLDKAIKTYSDKYGADAIMNYTVMLLRRFKPDVVVTHDVNGEYGHGVHKLCAYTMQKAITLSNDKAAFPETAEKYGTWNIKKCYLHLYTENSIIMDWNEPLDQFGGKTGMDMAKLGYQCHKSQLKKWFRVAEEGSPYDSRKFGLYYSTVGPDINKNDFFENIAPVMPSFQNTTTEKKTGKMTVNNPQSMYTDNPQTDQDTNTIVSVNNGSNMISGLTEVGKQNPQHPPRTIMKVVILAGIAIVLVSSAVALFLNRKRFCKRK